MKINHALNFAVPLYDDAGDIYAYVHSTPISYEAFEASHKLLSRTYTALLENGTEFLEITGPKIAGMAMRDVAKHMAGPKGDPALIAAAFLEEVRRLSVAIMPKESGWDPVPFAVAVDRKMISAEDAREVESALIFFTVTWNMLPKQLRVTLNERSAGTSGARLSSQTVTEFIASLRTSTGTANTGAKAAA